VKQQCLPGDFIVINVDPEKNTMHFYVRRRKRGRELTTGETERERVCVRGRAFEGREIASVQRSRASVQRSRHLHKHKWKCIMINAMNDVDKVTVYVRQNDTSVFPIDDI
jgi:hypothetical protein